MIFYQLYKKRGVRETLHILYGVKNYRCSLSEFFENLEELGSNYNSFFRARTDLLKMGLIHYRENRDKEKVIQLTSKGIKIVRILKEINDLMQIAHDVQVS
ncbi:MAG: hypothetical protein JW776_13735 [Candidatus Lokiarchaeota archaeon]|nr:hypothetical protein [Candidatus Lokiarchaeota archaeon]